MRSLTPNRREGLAVLAITLAGAVLRFWNFPRLGLTHFDEGVYAAAGAWALGPSGIAGLDPHVIAYAPPGFPALVGVAYFFMGLSDSACLLVAILCGALTVPAVAWLSWRSFGAGAGVAGALFAAASVAHVAFSRKALTDVPFLLSWLMAIGLGARFLEAPRVSRALALGMAVGLAQNFKYNGWLSGAVVLLAAFTGLLTDPGSRSRISFLRTFGYGLLAAVVACLAYWPWFRFVEHHGGYPALLAHQRSYLGASGTWLPHWRQQIAQVIALSGGRPWAVVTWGLAWTGAGFAVAGLQLTPDRSRWGIGRFRIGLGLGALVLVAVPDVGWWVGVPWFAWLLFDKHPALRLLGAWWLILTVLTPCYHPYARLWLPLHAAGWVLLAGAIVRIGPFTADSWTDRLRSAPSHPGRLAALAFALACLVVAKAHWRPPVPEPFAAWNYFRPTDELRRAVFDLGPKGNASPIPQGTTVCVLARRPVLFYLGQLRGLSVRPLPDRRQLLAGRLGPGEWALVDQVQFEQGAQYDVEGPSFLKRWVIEDSWLTPLDPITLLDYEPNAAFDGPLPAPTYLWLLAPRPPEEKGR